MIDSAKECKDLALALTCFSKVFEKIPLKEGLTLHVRRDDSELALMFIYTADAPLGGTDKLFIDVKMSRILEHLKSEKDVGEVAKDLEHDVMADILNYYLTRPDAIRYSYEI